MAPVQIRVYLVSEEDPRSLGCSLVFTQAEFSHCCQKRKCPSVTVAGSKNSHSRCKISFLLANGAVERHHLLRKCVNVCFLIFYVYF